MNYAPFWFSALAVDVDDTCLAKLTPDYALSGRECDACGERELHLELARFDVQPPKTIERRLLTGEETLSRQEYDCLLQHLAVDGPTKTALLPGTEIGKPIFRLLGRQHDFLSCNAIQIVSESVLACTRAYGVIVNAVPVEVVGRAKKIKSYFSLLPALRTVVDEAWLKEELVECAVCKQWGPKPGVRLRKKVLIDKAQVVKARWPKNQGVVYSPDLGNLLYSPEFVRACQEANLAGLGFRQVFWSGREPG